MVTISVINISSEHPQELGAFYRQVLGIEPEWQLDMGTGFRLGNVELVILGHDQVRGKNSQPARLFFNLNVDDVSAEFARVVAVGASIIQEPYSFPEPGGEAQLVLATLADPDGNYFQLMSTTPA
jgi:predicted enzyme related to lactoylglutathione lyase